MITQEIDLSLTDNLIPTVVHAKQYDHMGRCIKCSIYQDGELFSLEDGLVINVTGTRPDGNVFQYNSETDSDIVFVEDNTVCIQITDFMSADFGAVPVDVTLINESEETVGAFSFILRFEKAALQNAKLTRASFSGTLSSIIAGIVSCYITEDGYLCIESDDSIKMYFSMDDDCVLTMKY